MPAPYLERNNGRLTFTSNNKYSGLLKVVRSSYGGSMLAIWAKDDQNVKNKVITISPLGGEPSTTHFS